MNDMELLSEEQLDFLCEMMNIGAGNAATAFSQMLQFEVNIEIPAVRVLPSLKTPSILGDPSFPTACVRMGMVGDVAGDLYFIVPDEDKVNLIHFIERAMLGGIGVSPLIRRFSDSAVPDLDLSVLTEMGNILAGVYLTAIRDFCRLNIYHSVPTIAIDMIQSLLDESIVALSHEVEAIILIETKFILGENHIRTFLLLVPAVQSVKVLVDSIEQARMACREG